MNVLITGVTGFVGRRVAQGLLEDGHRVTGLARRGITPASVDMFHADIRDRDAVRRIVAAVAPEICVHLAAAASSSVRQGAATLVNEINVDGTRNVVDALERIGAGRMVLFSSAKVFGEVTPREGIDESAALLGRGIYADSKRAAEGLLRARVAAGSLRGTIVRPVPVVGRGNPRSNYASMYRMVRAGFFPLLEGGAARRSIVFIDNVVTRLRRMLRQDAGALESYVFSDGSWSVREIVDAMRVVAGYAICPILRCHRLIGGMKTVDARIARRLGKDAWMSRYLDRLTESFVIHPRRFDAAFGPLVLQPLDREMRRALG